MRLIDADALKSDIAKLKESPWFNIKEGYAYRQEAIITVEILCVDRAPTVDAVEVVRCKDCKRWERDTFFQEGWCRGRRQGDPNWFCADGERREDADK